MGAPVKGIEAAEDPSASALLDSLKTIAAAERRKHASVYNYWLTIKGDKPFPPIRDLDPLEISDAGPFSVLLEMIGGGEDADIRHIGQAIKGDAKVEKVGEAIAPCLLSSIAQRLPIVSACREAFAFEDEWEGPDGKTRCWVTLLPFSATGTWIDYVYGFVSLDPAPGALAEEPEVVEETAEVAEEAPDAVAEAVEPEPEPVAEVIEPEPEPVAEVVEPEPEPVAEVFEPEPEPEPEFQPEPEFRPEPEFEAKPAKATKAKAGFSAKLFESLASVGGFYGGSAQAEPVIPVVPFEEEPPVLEEVAEPTVAEDEVEPPVTEEAVEPAIAEKGIEPPVVAEEPAEPETKFEGVEGPMHSKLAEVQAKADEARQAKLRSNAALYEGLSAAYDFALDAEDHPEEYLKLVEGRGLKIQLRSPMKPVVRLAFDGMCDDSMIAQLETVLAWALKNDLPRGSLAERIQTEGGLGPILNGAAAAA
jgi:hypothetical protein